LSKINDLVYIWVPNRNNKNRIDPRTYCPIFNTPPFTKFPFLQNAIEHAVHRAVHIIYYDPISYSIEKLDIFKNFSSDIIKNKLNIKLYHLDEIIPANRHQEVYNVMKKISLPSIIDLIKIIALSNLGQLGLKEAMAVDFDCYVPVNLTVSSCKLSVIPGISETVAQYEKSENSVTGYVENSYFFVKGERNDVLSRAFNKVLSYVKKNNHTPHCFVYDIFTEEMLGQLWIGSAENISKEQLYCKYRYNKSYGGYSKEPKNDLEQEFYQLASKIAFGPCTSSNSNTSWIPSPAKADDINPDLDSKKYTAAAPHLIKTIWEQTRDKRPLEHLPRLSLSDGRYFINDHGKKYRNIFEPEAYNLGFPEEVYQAIFLAILNLTMSASIEEIENTPKFVGRMIKGLNKPIKELLNLIPHLRVDIIKKLPTEFIEKCDDPGFWCLDGYAALEQWIMNSLEEGKSSLEYSESREEEVSEISSWHYSIP
jgi:hypothetical protein